MPVRRKREVEIGGCEWVWFPVVWLDPVLVNCRMNISTVQWSPDGSLLAIGGSQTFQEGKGLSCVQFYNCWGKVRRQRE